MRGRRFSLLLGVGLGTLVGSYPLWLSRIGCFLLVADDLEPADAVVPLATGRERVRHAATLFRAGFARFFVATNPPHNLPGIDVSHAELVCSEAAAAGVPREQIRIAQQPVLTTFAEALAVRDLAVKEGWSSLLIVTSSYHTWRSRYIFRDVFRHTGIRIRVYPAANSGYHASTWWRRPDDLRTTWTEYVQILLYLAGYRQ